MDHRAIRIGEARRRRLIAGELLLRACDVAHGPYVTAAIEITRPGHAVALIFVRLACRVAARTAFCARRASFALAQLTVARVERLLAGSLVAGSLALLTRRISCAFAQIVVTRVERLLAGSLFAGSLALRTRRISCALAQIVVTSVECLLARAVTFGFALLTRWISFAFAQIVVARVERLLAGSIVAGSLALRTRRIGCALA